MTRLPAVSDPLARRRFLGLALAGAAGSVLWPSSTASATPITRTLAFLNTHTGESVSTVYWSDGAYVPEALAAINRVLRDHRTGEVITIDRHLLDVLHGLRADLGTAAPFHVISCYRSPKTNAALRAGGHAVAEKSLHMQGRAADVRLPGIALDDLHRAAVARKAGGVGYYSGPLFVHVDVGRVRYW